MACSILPPPPPPATRPGREGKGRQVGSSHAQQVAWGEVTSLQRRKEKRWGRVSSRHAAASSREARQVRKIRAK